MNKTELESHLDDAHDALAYGIAQVNDRVRAARRARCTYPACSVFLAELGAALFIHEGLKRNLRWLGESQRKVVRAKAAAFVRRDLETQRRLRSEAALPLAA